MINLFIGSDAEIKVSNDTVRLQQVTNYPWDGKITVNVDPRKESEFKIKVRIPGWATGVENPFGLYQSSVKQLPTVVVNGSAVNETAVDGYISISRRWTKGDKIEINLPMEPRLVYANEKVYNLKDMVSVASGPLVYCFEESLNNGFSQLEIDPTTPGDLNYQAELLQGVNTISGKTKSGAKYQAIPYYAVGNLRPGDRYKVWIPTRANE
jgi:DUF1680 family protein